MRQYARGVTAVLVAMGVLAGCASDPDVGLSSHRKVYADAGQPEADGGLPEVDAGTPPGCTLTPGYWKNHFEVWEGTSLTLGGVVYSDDELLALLSASVRGDASITLAKHLIAALLNGGESDPNISDVIAEAQAWLAANADGDGRLPFGLAPGSAAHGEATDLAGDLAAYNEGDLGTPHCD